MSSTEYLTLSADVSAGVLAACQAEQPMGSCSVTDVTFFPRDDSNVFATFTLRVSTAVTASQVTDIFRRLVSLAEENQLIANRVVLANTVTLGSSKQNENYNSAQLLAFLKSIFVIIF